MEPTQPPESQLPTLDELKHRIDRARGPEEEEKKGFGSTGYGFAMRLVVELVVGVFVGGFIGYYLDLWLDTRPWFFIVCFLLGTCAAGLNIYRLASRQNSDKNNTSN